MTETQEMRSGTVVCRKPVLQDGARVHQLVDACKPLDLNSVYSYMLLCTHFAETCAVGEIDGDLVGFVSGYLKPTDPEVLFIWQVAVHSKARGHRVATRLLHELLERPACRKVTHLETTVTPSNEPSLALFRSFAGQQEAPCTESVMFRQEDFGSHEHEEEHLLRIGPL